MATRMMMAAATLGALSSKMVGDIFFFLLLPLGWILGESEVGNKLLREFRFGCPELVIR